jgi:hypothetical protein
MKRPLTLSLTLTIISLLPLQAVYADGLLPAQATPVSTKTAIATPTTASFQSVPVATPMVQATATNLPIQPLTADQAQDLIQITQSSIPLSSKLQKSNE